jgi:FAD/FMN-containing dehydrogenase
MVGELYYAVAKNNPGLAFPAGVCPTIGVGGHFRGGGIGMIMRKYGLSIDNVVDSKLIDPKGDLLDWANMAEDLFWAIRGGGGGSFGIVVSWKVTLVKVPPTVTVITTVRTVDQGAIGIVTKWQSVAPYLPNDITMRVIVQGQQAVFQSVNLGTCDEILPTLASRFQELGRRETIAAR